MPCENELISGHTSENSRQKLDLPQGVPPLRSLYLYITDSCNLACRHCWITPSYRQDGEGGKHIKLSYVKKAVQEAKPMGLHTIKVTGGEPTIHPKFKELITLIDREKLKIYIETNGTLINKKLASFLRENNVSFISVSVDGANADSHDWLRGVEGSHIKALNGIQNLVKVGFRPQMICTLYKKNVSEIKEIVSLAEKSGCGSVKFNHVQHIGRGKQFSEEYGLKVEEILDLFNWIEEEIIPRSKIRIFFDIPFAFYPIRKLLKSSLSHCYVHNILGILAGGELALCGIGVNIPELVYGNIEADNLREVWVENPKLIRMREQIPFKLEGICSECIHRDLCVGRCVADNFQRTKKLNSAYYFCKKSEEMGLFPETRRKLKI